MQDATPDPTPSNEQREITVSVPGARRRFRVFQGRLQTLYGLKWRTAGNGRMANMAREQLGLPIKPPPPSDGADTQRPEVVFEGKRYRRSLTPGEVEVWMPPTRIPFDWGLQTRAGYWRTVPKRRRWSHMNASEMLARVHAALSANGGGNGL